MPTTQVTHTDEPSEFHPTIVRVDCMSKWYRCASRQSGCVDSSVCVSEEGGGLG